jgi:hypothetical protein
VAQTHRWLAGSAAAFLAAACLGLVAWAHAGWSEPAPSVPMDLTVPGSILLALGLCWLGGCLLGAAMASRRPAAWLLFPFLLAGGLVPPWLLLAVSPAAASLAVAGWAVPLLAWPGTALPARVGGLACIASSAAAWFLREAPRGDSAAGLFLVAHFGLAPLALGLGAAWLARRAWPAPGAAAGAALP